MQHQEEFEPIEGTLGGVFGSGKDDVKRHLVPPDLEQTDDELWCEYLDKIDVDSRLRRRNSPAMAAATSGNRDDVAAWLAMKHFNTDRAVREIWYLPQGSPPNDLRFLELDDPLTGSESNIEAIDFGLQIEGAAFRRLMADITSEQLEEIKKNPNRLPSGWFLDSNVLERRGA